MAHDRLMNQSIVVGNGVLEIVTTIDQRREWGEFLGGRL